MFYFIIYLFLGCWSPTSSSNFGGVQHLLRSMHQGESPILPVKTMLFLLPFYLIVIFLFHSITDIDSFFCSSSSFLPIHLFVSFNVRSQSLLFSSVNLTVTTSLISYWLKIDHIFNLSTTASFNYYSCQVFYYLLLFTSH